MRAVKPGWSLRVAMSLVRYRDTENIPCEYPRR